MTMLEVENVGAAYDDLQVLWDVSLTIEEEDSVVALIGPNGAGKTTLLKTISGILEPIAGSVHLFGTETRGLSPTDIVERGFVHVPEKRNLFGDMTVYENLQMGAYTQRDRFEETTEEMFALFPVLEERREQKAGTLSGGEQQMLAIARGLMAHPKILALDEPSGALAPKLAQRVFDRVEEISDDITVLLVEQHVDQALKLADRGYLLENGEIVTTGSGDELLESEHVRQAYLQG